MPEPRLSAGESRKQENRARRLARYEEVVELKRRGLTNMDIVRRTGGAPVCDSLTSARLPSRTQAAGTALKGARRIPRLHRAAVEAGGEKCLLALSGDQRTRLPRHLLHGRARPRAGLAPCRPAYSARRTPPARLGSTKTWLLTLSEEERPPAQRSYLAALRDAWPQVRQLERLTREFIGVFHHQDASTIGTGIQEAEKTPLRRFARGLFSDIRAIRAASELPRSNGPTEGHINRSKALKRQVYGRASFDLLRVRLLAAA